jgi:hypothetical protein
LSGTVDYAYSHSKDLLLSRPVSLVNGVANELYNGGSKNSHDIEVDILGQVVRARDFRWDLFFNISRTRENVLEGTNVIAGLLNADNYLGINNREIIMRGFPVDGFFSYRFTGLDENGAPTFGGLFENFPTSYEKLQAVMSYQGRKLPDFYGGFGTSVSYRNFTLSANFTYKFGQKVRLLEMYRGGVYMPLSHQNMRSEFVDRWRQPGDQTDIPALSAQALVVSGIFQSMGMTPSPILSTFMPTGRTSLYQLYDLSDLRTARGDYIRCQSITLSWRCPREYVEKIGLKAATLRAQVQNPFVWAFDKKLRGQDPEQVGSIGLPALTSFSFGLNITF